MDEEAALSPYFSPTFQLQNRPLLLYTHTIDTYMSVYMLDVQLYTHTHTAPESDVTESLKTHFLSLFAYT